MSSLFLKMKAKVGNLALDVSVIRLSIAVVFVIFAVEFMNTTANSTKTTAINDNAQIFFCISRKFKSFRAKNFQNFFQKFFSKKKFQIFFFKNNFGNVK